MPKIQIDGVGTVEVDDSFLTLSPEEQDETIQEIAAEIGKRTTQPQADITPPSAPSPASPIAASQQIVPDNTPLQPADNSKAPFSDEWLAEQERLYQQSLQSQRSLEREEANAPKADRTTGLQAGVLGFADSLTFGFGDEIDAAMGTILGDGATAKGYKTIWDGLSFSDAYHANVAENRQLLDEAQDEHSAAYLAGNIAGGFVPVGGTLTAAKSATGLSKLKRAAGAGAAYGGLYGMGSDTGDLEDRIDGTVKGAAIGAAGGAGLYATAKGAEKVLSPAVERLFPKVAAARFAREQEGNPFAPIDAEIANDLNKIVENISPGNRKLSKAKRDLLLSRINDLERSYLPLDEIASLDIPPSAKARLRAALAKRHMLSPDEVAQVADGTPAGEAAAEAIGKAIRLRSLVTEFAESGSSTGRILGETVGSAAGWKLAGPLGGAIGGRLGRAAMRKEQTDAAKQAVALADKAPLYSELPSVIAARETESPTAALSRLSDEARDAQYLAAQDAERLAEEGKRVAIANARDDIRPSGGWRGLIYEKTGLLPSQQDAGTLMAMQDGAISKEQFDAFLKDPSKLMAGNVGNALMDRLSAMAESGRIKRDPKWSPATGVTPVIREGAWGSLDELPANVLDDAYAEFLERNPGAIAQATVGPDGQLIVTGTLPGIRNPAAYAATANANQQRVTDSLKGVMDDPFLEDDIREIIASAVTGIGNTSSRSKAQEIATDALDRLSDDHRAYARSILSPLVEQIRR